MEEAAKGRRGRALTAATRPSRRFDSHSPPPEIGYCYNGLKSLPCPLEKRDDRFAGRDPSSSLPSLRLELELDSLLQTVGDQRQDLLVLIQQQHRPQVTESLVRESW